MPASVPGVPGAVLGSPQGLPGDRIGASSESRDSPMRLDLRACRSRMLNV